MFRAIADVLRQIGGAIATVVTLPFRALARLFGGASRSGRRTGPPGRGDGRARPGRPPALIPDCRCHLPQLPRNPSEKAVRDRDDTLPRPPRGPSKAGSPRNSAYGSGRSRPPSNCSTAVRRCPSSPATARKRPRCSTTRSCARSRSGCAICGSWRSGGRRSSTRCASRASSPTSWRRGSGPRTPRRAWRTSTCRSSRSGAPRRRSPARRGSSRSPRACSATRPWTRIAAAAAFVDADKGVADPQAALDGARAILTERFSEDADLIGELRERMWVRGRLAAKVRDGKEEAGAKFADYFDFAEPFTDAALAPRSSRCCAARRRRSSTSSWSPRSRRADRPVLVRGDRRPPVRHRRPGPSRPTSGCRTRSVGPGAPASSCTSASTCGCGCARPPRTRRCDVFAANLRDLLLAAPAGTRATLGLDPGFRTGVKVAVVDATGKVVATDVIHPHVPANKWDEAIAKLARLAKEHAVELVAIGNGTASRETDKLAGELIAKHPELNLTKVMVSEAGASVYSASAFASQELPDMDVSLRGAVSIARRLQDPLAELVKIDPKSIGVGQYQHDLSEVKLSRSLDAVVEDCVNGVGVDVNTASAPLLARVSGITLRARREHRGAPRRERPVHVPHGAQGRGAARPEGVRAVRGLPAHPRRRRPAGRVQRAPRGVPGGAAHGEDRRAARSPRSSATPGCCAR